jgi:predicted ribosome quality control (RQC) complex YloA/Tae2 family protein
MLLRKHIQGGTICSVKQYGMDRVIEIGIKAANELGVTTVKGLICEIIGRYSNIILVDGSNKVIDSIRRVTPDMSSIRRVMPGLAYDAPPSQNKLNMISARKEQMAERFMEYHGKKCERAVADVIDGIGRVLSREICAVAGIDPDRPCTCDKTVLLAQAVVRYKDLLDRADFTPVIYYRDNKPVEFSPVFLNHLNLDYQLQNSVNTMLDEYYRQKLIIEQFERKKEALARTVAALANKNRKKLDAQQYDYNKAKDYDRLRVFGELITANLHRLKDKAACVTVQNFYSPSLSDITIELDPNLTPAQNAQKFFREYNKLKRTLDNLKFHIERTKMEIDYLDSVLYNIEKSVCLDDLEQIRQELIKEGYIEPKYNKTPANKVAGLNPFRYISDDGLDILVGRNNYQNDRLTLKYASKDDLWLHIYL